MRQVGLPWTLALGSKEQSSSTRATLLLVVRCSSAGGAEEDFCIPEERECDGRQPIVLLVLETG
jgi:hypothetical protein